MAGVYEGFRIGKAEIGKTSVGTPQGTGSVNAVRYSDGEFAVEGVDMPLRRVSSRWSASR